MESRNEAVVWRALSPNGKTRASGSEDRTMRLWDVETEEVAAKWTGHAVIARLGKSDKRSSSQYLLG